MKLSQWGGSGHRPGRWWPALSAVGTFCRDLILDWTKRDRIRVSPTVGRLLGLREGDRILLFDEVYVLRKRCFCETTMRVVYDLAADDRAADDLSASLLVPIGDDGLAAEGFLDREGTRRMVFDDDVAVLRKERSG